MPCLHQPGAGGRRLGGRVCYPRVCYPKGWGHQPQVTLDYP
jgi:hypothetical protein